MDDESRRIDGEQTPEEIERVVDEAAAIEAARREQTAEGCAEECAACPCAEAAASDDAPEPAPDGDVEPAPDDECEPEEAPVPYTPQMPERSESTGPELELGVAFPHNAKVYSFASGGLRARIGEKVLVRTDLGVDLGDVVKIKGRLSPERAEELTSVVRVATDEDMAHAAEQERRERRALEVCDERITAHKLPMKLIDAHLSFDNTRLVFLFASEGRVDFRELVRDLAKTFRMRIELRQVGVRDEAKLLGGLGPCGRQLCCKMFMRNFEPVGIRIAKDQGLALNPNKLSGLCDRLMCCLRFEHQTYVDHKARLPKKGVRVQVGGAAGQVVSVYLLKEELRIRMEDGRDVTVHRSEVKPLAAGEGPAQPPVVEREDTPERPARPERPQRVTTRPASKQPTEEADERKDAAAEGKKQGGKKSERSRGRRRSSSRRKKQKSEGASAQGDGAAGRDSGKRSQAGPKPAPQGGGDKKQSGGGVQESGKPKRKSRGRRGRGRSRKPGGQSGGQSSGGTQN